VSAQVDAEALGGAADRLVEQVVVEGTDRSGLLVDEVVVAVVGVGDLVAGDAVSAVEAVEQPELVELLQDAVDGRVRADPLRAEMVDDPLGVEQALALPCEQLDDRGPSRPGMPSGPGDSLLGAGKPAITQRRVHPRQDNQDEIGSQLEIQPLTPAVERRHLEGQSRRAGPRTLIRREYTVLLVNRCLQLLRRRGGESWLS
jgi:hypothetical protein